MAQQQPSNHSKIDIWRQDADLEEQVREHEEKVRGARGWALLALAYSTCGIVYGDIGTSPLYVMAAIFPEGAPADDPNTILGAFAMIFWAITAVVLVKYIVVVLRADNNGEGGTFALYSNICRAANLRVHATDLGLMKMASEGGEAGPASPGGVRRRLAARLRYWLESSPRAQLVLLLVTLMSACMVMSDGVLTPAISVVSAIEGIQYNAGISKGAVVGITCGILILLFILQSQGTEKVSFLFSPFILVWLLANAAIGFYNIFTYDPAIWRALSPHYLYYYWAGQASWGWQNLGHVMLAITGTEALFADLGHFSRAAIRLSFCGLVYPCLALTYLGQTAFILQSPESASAAFWASQPLPLKWPMVVLATAAAIIASQALITGCFSIVQQAVALNCFPRVKVKHTSHHIMGQVYIPTVNALLGIGCVAVVLIFQTSTRIGNAYGLAVNMVELATTSLVSLLMIVGWEAHPAAVGAFWLTFTSIEAAFLSSNLSKVPKGAWFTLVLSTVLTLITYTWHWGQEQKLRYIRRHAVPLRTLLTEEPSSAAGPTAPLLGGGGAGAGGVGRGSNPSRASISTASSAKEGVEGWAGGALALRLEGGQEVSRVPGVGLYYNELLTDLPPVLTHFVRLVPALHRVVVFLTLRSVPLPHVARTERLLIRKLRYHGFYHAVVRLGYMDRVVHDAQFVDHIMQEILEYLSPGMGFEESVYDPEGSHHGSYYSAAAWRPAPGTPQPGFYPTVASVAGPGSVMGTVHSYMGSVMAAALREDLESGTVHSIEGRDMAATMSNALRLGRVSVPLAPTAEGHPRAPNSVISFTYINYQGGPAGQEGDMPWVQNPSAYRRMRTLAMRAGAQAAGGGAAEGTAALHEAVYGAMTMPLPRPPPRPAVRIPLLSHAALTSDPEEEDMVSGPRTMPLPAAPARPSVAGLVHRGAPGGAFRASTGAEAGLQLRSPPGPTIPEVSEDPSTHHTGSPSAAAASAGACASSTPAGLATLPEGIQLDPRASPTATTSLGAGNTTRGSGRQKARPRLPAWWARRGGSAGGSAEPTAPSPDNSLSPLELKTLARDLAKKLAEGRQPGEAGGPSGSAEAELGLAGAERDLEMGMMPTTSAGDEARPSRPAAEGSVLAPAEPQVEDLGVSGGTTADEAVVAFAAAAVDRRQIFNMHSTATFAAADAAPAGPGGQAVDGGAMAAERAYVEAAYHEAPVSYLLGKSQLRAANRSAWFKVLVLEGFYGFLAANTHSTPDSYCIPSDAMLELGVTYEV